MAKEPPFPWQQKVVDADLAPPDALPIKINIAERAIAARLNDPNLGRYERVALRDGLSALRVLIAECKSEPARTTDENKKKDIA